MKRNKAQAMIDALQNDIPEDISNRIPKNNKIKQTTVLENIANDSCRWVSTAKNKLEDADDTNGKIIHNYFKVLISGQKNIGKPIFIFHFNKVEHHEWKFE